MVEPAFRSALEAGVAAQLEAAGVTYEYEQRKLRYLRRVSRGICSACKGTRVSQQRTYLPDFIIGDIILEVKGYFHSADRAKMLAVMEGNPGTDLRFLFGADNKIKKGSDDRYSDWCTKHGFQYAVRIIPKHWLKAFTTS